MTAENLEARYERVHRQLQELTKKTEDRVARMATMAAVLHHKMPHFSWTGFYILSDGDLIVGPYQGPLACQVLERKRGVCWAGILGRRTVVVPDVAKFPGHIACDSRSKSEIVVPLFGAGAEPWAVLDVDSRRPNAFSDVDRAWLERIALLVGDRNPVNPNKNGSCG